jgi:protein-disulfide isomerase
VVLLFAGFAGKQQHHKTLIELHSIKVIMHISPLVRSLTLLCCLLVVAACGPEAPPRAARPAAPAPTPLIPQPTPQQVAPAADTPAAPDNPRALGDPAAPITVVEFSDYQ